MKFRKFIYSIILLLGSYAIHAQLPDFPYEPIDFETINPVWYKTVYDSAIVGLGENDGYNYIFDVRGVEPIVTEDAIFSVYTFRGEADLHAGVIIERRRLTDGELVWRQKFDVFDNDRQERPNRMYLDDEGNLVILGMKRVTPYGVKEPQGPSLMIFGGSRDCRYSKRVYSIDSGKLLYFNNPDLNDESLVKVRADDGLRFRQTFDFHVLPTNQIIYVAQSIQYVNSVARDVLTFHALNDRGELIYSYDTIVYQGINDIRNFTPLGDGYFDIEEYYDTLGQKHANFIFFNDSLKIARKLAIELPEKSVRLTLLDIKDDKLLIGNTRSILPPYNTQEIETLVYDLEGNILKSNYLGTRYWSFYHIKLIEWDDENILLAAEGIRGSTQGYNIHFDIIKSNDELGIYDLLRTHLNSDPKRYISPNFIHKLDNGNYLMQFYESVYYKMQDGIYAQDARAYAQSLMEVTPYDLGILTSNTEDIGDTDVSIKVYPNPASTQLNIEIEDKTSIQSIEIFDVNGRKILEERNIDQSVYVLDISGLQSGSYYIHVRDKSGEVLNRKFIKI